MIIIVDGNDGTGKSTLVAELRTCGHMILDRGLPTRMTDNAKLTSKSEDEYYLILDADVATCQQRLAQAGKDLTEQYHTVEDLTHYQQRFLEVAKRLPRCVVIDARGTPDQVLATALATIEQWKLQQRST